MPPRRVIGIDAGGTKLLGGVVDEGLVVHHRVHRTWRGADRGETLDIMVAAVDEARTASPGIEAVGFGIPALVEPASGVARFSTHLPLADVPFRDLMSERLGLPVYVDNDATLALLAEARAGAAEGARHAALVALGTGIGGGLLLDGRLYRGAHGFAGELGHIVLDVHGPECRGSCPGRGCLEVVASGSAIGVAGERTARDEPGSALGARAGSGHEITGALVTELAHAGDEPSRRVLREVGEQLGAGLVSVVNALDPEVIVVGGGALAAGELLLEPARAVVAERALPPSARSVRIVPAGFGEEAGMLGAALFAFERGES